MCGSPLELDICVMLKRSSGKLCDAEKVRWEGSYGNVLWCDESGGVGVIVGSQVCVWVSVGV